MFRIGITGTRNSITEVQEKHFRGYLDSLLINHKVEELELHHGDCIGADVTAATIAQSLGIRIICHPPVKDELRAWHESDLILPVNSYFARNRAIVNNTDILIGLPKDDNVDGHIGGTIYTINYAIKHKKNVYILFPSGGVRRIATTHEGPL